jgi:hypothetical protein
MTKASFNKNLKLARFGDIDTYCDMGTGSILAKKREIA